MLPNSKSVFSLLTLVTVTVNAAQLLNLNTAFDDAGILGCISVANNTLGSPVVVHNCDTASSNSTNWSINQQTGPQQVKIFGDKCLDVKDGINAPGTPLQIWECSTGNKNQQWISISDYLLRWNGTDKCVDLSNGNIQDGNPLQIWTCDTHNMNQLWGVKRSPSSTIATQDVNIVPAPLGFCMTPTNNTNGAPVVNIDCLASTPKWTAPLAPQIGPIKIFGSKCLDVTNGLNANGNKLQIYDCNEGNTNQMWQLVVRQFKWVGKRKCVDLTDGKTNNGNPIQIYDCGGSDPDTNANQEWYFITF